LAWLSSVLTPAVFTPPPPVNIITDGITHLDTGLHKIDSTKTAEGYRRKRVDCVGLYYSRVESVFNSQAVTAVYTLITAYGLKKTLV